MQEARQQKFSDISHTEAYEKEVRTMVLEGYKAYLGGAGAILLGIYYLIEGKTEDAGVMIALGLGIIGIRNKQERIKPEV